MEHELAITTNKLVVRQARIKLISTNYWVERSDDEQQVRVNSSNSCKLVFFSFFILISCSLMLTCDLFFSSPDKLSFTDGYGAVRISFNEEARTIFPNKDFDNITYTFTKQGEEPQVMMPEEGFFNLPAGNWNVKVDAYIGNAEPENLVATGNADFTLAVDDSITVQVSLNAYKTDGYGTFSYYIRYPANTTVMHFKLTNMFNMTVIDFSSEAGETGISGIMQNIPAGNYQLDIWLKNERIDNFGFYILATTTYPFYTGIIKMVHIYDELITEFGTEQLPVIFNERDFTTMAPENLPVAQRWWNWLDDVATVTLEHTVNDEGVCVATVGGITDYNLWVAGPSYEYTAKANASYAYVFEAWTAPGEGNRRISLLYYWDAYPASYLSTYTPITITETRTTYTVFGERLPKGGIRNLIFHCSDQTGTFYLKVLDIIDNTIEETETSLTEAKWRQILQEIEDDPYFNGVLDLSDYTRSNSEIGLRNNGTFDPGGWEIEIGKNKITTLILPDEAVRIVESGFNYYFDNLEYIEGRNITSIGNYAFSWCTSLLTASFPLVTYIGENAFYYCTSLTSFELSATANIAGNPFTSCTTLTTFIVNGSGPLSVIESGKALVRYGTELVVYPSASGSITMNTITKIGDYAFYENLNLTDVSFPLVTEIGDYAFGSCSNLNSAIFPVVKIIGMGAFILTNLTTVTLGTIEYEWDFGRGTNPFYGSNLRDVYFAPGGGAGTYTTSNPGWDAVWEKQ